MKALILAAGAGSRLFPLIKDKPKALLPLGDETILARLLRQLAAFAVDEAIVVIGYRAASVRTALAQPPLPVRFVENPRFATTNTAYSAHLAAEAAAGTDLLVIDGDLVTTDAILQRAVHAPGNVLFFEAKGVLGEEEMRLQLDETPQRVTALGRDLDAGISAGEFIGLARLTHETTPAWFHALRQAVAENPASYYEAAFNLILPDIAFAAEEVPTGDWVEVDFFADYREALRRFAPGAPDPERQAGPQVLLTPGPVMVSQAVKQALMHSDIAHREDEFSETLLRVRQKLLTLYGVGNSHAYTAVVLTGSGTAANEALLSSYGPGRRLLVLSNGEFGQRLWQIAQRHRLTARLLDFGWGQPFDLDRVAATLRDMPQAAVVCVHHETSTGMLNPLPQLGHLCRDTGAELLVDAVSSLGAERIDLEANGITFCSASANKALASVPGLAFVAGKREAFLALKDRAPTIYLDLYRHFEYEDHLYQTPNTPAVPLFFAADAALTETLAEGLSARMARLGRLAAQVRAALPRLGSAPVIAPEWMSRVLTTAWYPPGVEPEAFHQRLKERGFVVYRGKGPYHGRAFQIANIGAVGEEHIAAFFNAAADVIDELERKTRV